MPLVSIVVPCFNAAKFVEAALDSIIGQTFHDWELILVDDGSSDGSADVVEAYIGRIEDGSVRKRCHLMRQSNQGACFARNEGLRVAQGEYVKFLDADDILTPNCLEEQLGQIRSLNENQIPFGMYGNIDEEGKVLSMYDFPPSDIEQIKCAPVEYFFYKWFVLITAPLHRIELLRKVGGFNVALQCGQEFDLHFRLALMGVEWCYFPTNTFYYRDYVSDTRISCISQGRTERKKRNLYVRMETAEKLLTEKYGKIPSAFSRYICQVWFDHARELFASGDKPTGEVYLQRYSAYGNHTRFEKTYLAIGRVLGFVTLEKILQMRLKLMGKK